MVMPQALVDQGITDIANVRVDFPAAAAIVDLFDSIYADEGVEIVADIPVPAGTTDYSQFVLAADLAASGEDALQPRQLKATPMRSWMGVYALLTILRESGTEDFSRENITELTRPPALSTCWA